MTAHVGEGSPHHKIETGRRKNDSLARRPIASQTRPSFALYTKRIGVETLVPGEFVNVGFSTAKTNDPSVFGHLAETSPWNVFDTDNIDGAGLILRRGIYEYGAMVTFGLTVPSDSQLVEIFMQSIGLNYSGGPPTPIGVWGGGGIGSLASPNSIARGQNIDGQALWVFAIGVEISGGNSFRPVAIKPRVTFSGPGSNLQVSAVHMWIRQIVELECSSANYLEISGDGIPSSWLDDELICSS